MDIHCAKFNQGEQLLVFTYALLEKQWGAVVEKTNYINKQHNWQAANNADKGKAYVQCSEQERLHISGI
jgi:hypothetical protein